MDLKRQDENIELRELQASTDTAPLMNAQDGTHDKQETSILVSQKGAQGGYIRSTITAFGVFLPMVAIYAWLYHSFDVRSGSATLVDDSCSNIRAYNIGIHVVLNVASTLLFGAATFCMQVLCAPTREAVDKAHQQRHWLDVGLQSPRNLYFAGPLRQVLWLVLTSSVIFLHLTFNGVFFVASQTNQYAVALASPAHLTNQSYNCTASNPDQFKQNTTVGDRLDMFANKTGCPISDLLAAYSHNDASFVELPLLDCVERYGQTILTGSGSIVLVGETGNSTNLTWARWPERYLANDETNGRANEWVCHDFISDPTNERCTAQAASHHLSDNQWTVYGHTVQQCFAQPISNSCKLRFNVWMMLAVVIFSGFSVIIILATSICFHRSRFLYTLGDAIVSFLRTPDPDTLDLCMASKKDLSVYERTGIKPGSRHPPSEARRWFQALSTWRWWVVHASYLLLTILFGVCVFFAYHGARGTAFSNEIGATDLESVETVTHEESGSSAFLPTVIVANIPQLAYTLVNFGIGGMLKNMCESVKGSH